MNLHDYFDPVSLEKPEFHHLSEKAVFCRNIIIHTPDSEIKNISRNNIALVGLPEDRNAGIKGSAQAPDLIRSQLYQLFRLDHELKIIDLGNLKPGNAVQDTYFALRDVTLELMDQNIILVIMGGSQDLTYGTYLAFEKMESLFSFATVDSRLDMGIISDDVSPDSYLIPILSRKKELLYNYTNLGHQKYLVDWKDFEFLNQQYHDTIRLGDIRANIAITEPVIRDAGFISFDLNAIRQSDAPGSLDPSPNGLYAEEACQISRYAGLSNKLTSFGIFNLLPERDSHDQTSHLAAQMIWYFLEGVSQRKLETPSGRSALFKKFIVSTSQTQQEIVFYKSNDTERWWVEVPIISDSRRRKVLISCSHNDYQRACNQEIPERWLKAYQKLN